MTPRQKASKGLELLEESVLDLLTNHPEGLSNSVIERELGIESDRNGEQRGWLCWSVLSTLISKKRIAKQGERARARYRLLA
jgi:hypothetical protein